MTGGQFVPDAQYPDNVVPLPGPTGSSPKSVASELVALARYTWRFTTGTRPEGAFASVRERSRCSTSLQCCSGAPNSRPRCPSPCSAPPLRAISADWVLSGQVMLMETVS